MWQDFLYLLGTRNFNKFSTTSTTEPKIGGINLHLELSQAPSQQLISSGIFSILKSTEANQAQPEENVSFEDNRKHNQCLQKSVNDRRLHWNPIKSYFHSILKLLTKTANIKDTRTKSHSAESQSWADLRVSPKIPQKL